MSDTTNTQLLEEAAHYIDYFTDTTVGKILEDQVQRNDLEGLKETVQAARVLAHDMEYEPDGVNE